VSTGSNADIFPETEIIFSVYFLFASLLFSSNDFIKGNASTVKSGFTPVVSAGFS